MVTLFFGLHTQMKQYEIFVTVNPTMTGLLQGVSQAAQAQIRQALGPDLKVYRPVTRELIGVLQVEDDVDINRILDPGMFRAVFPSISKVEAISVEYKGPLE